MATRGKRRRKTPRKYVPLYIDKEFYEGVLLPLLDLFSVADDVFTEDDALEDAKLRMGLARIYRGWKRCRIRLDPEFKNVSDQRPAKWLPTQVRVAKRERSRRATE